MVEDLPVTSPVVGLGSGIPTEGIISTGEFNRIAFGPQKEVAGAIPVDSDSGTDTSSAACSSANFSSTSRNRHYRTYVTPTPMN